MNEIVNIKLEKEEDFVDSNAKQYLPKWVLEMRSKITASRAAYNDTNNRLIELSNNSTILNDKLLLITQHKSINNTHKQKFNHPIKNNNNYYYYYNNIKITTLFSFKIFEFPPDLLFEILTYLNIINVFTLEIVGRNCYRVIIKSYYWVYCNKCYFVDLSHNSVKRYLAIKYGQIN